MINITVILDNISHTLFPVYTVAECQIPMLTVKVYMEKIRLKMLSEAG